MCLQTFRMIFLFSTFCVISAMDVEESITVNKPVIRPEIPPWTQLATDNDIVDYDSTHAVISRAHNAIFADSTKNPKGYVRCYCNLPACVSTGYMCKSSGGECFSDLNHHSTPQSVYHGRHGCLELLTDKEERDFCQRYSNGNQHPIRRKNSHPKSLFYCCYHDMCNHADDPQIKDLINDTTLGEILNEEHRAVESQLDNGYTSSDVWFKAATIAVPICGAVILFVLIALAIRLLKTETFNGTDYKLGCTYSSPDRKKSCKKHPQHYHTSQHLLYKDIVPQHNPMYANHVIVGKQNSRSSIITHKDTNVKNAKINFYNGNEYNLLPQNPHIFEIHKCYENKGNFLSNAVENSKKSNIQKNSSPEIGYCNPTTTQRNGTDHVRDKVNDDVPLK